MARPTSTATSPRLLEFQRRGLLDIESLISDRIALDGNQRRLRPHAAGVGSRSVVLF